MKKLYKYLLTSILFLGLVQFAQGQVDFLSGYIINSENDTIYGEIEFRDDRENCKVCFFRQDPESEAIQFYPGDIEAYRIDYGKYYISRDIEIEGESKQVFLEYLVNGISDLYYYRSEGHDHYFLESREGRFLELNNDVVTEKIGGVTTVGPSKEYIAQLQASFADCPEIQKDIQYSQLGHESLITLVDEYHDYVCDDEVCIIYEKELPRIKFRIGPMAGVGFTNVINSWVLQFQDPFTEINYSRSPTLFIGLQMRVGLDQIDEKFSLEMGSWITRNSFSDLSIVNEGNGTRYYESREETQSVQSSLAMKYSFAGGRIRPTLALGIQGLYIFDQSADFSSEHVLWDRVAYGGLEDFPLIAPIQFGFIAEAGIDYELNDRHILFTALRYCYSHGEGKDERIVDTRTHFLNMVLGFYF